MAKSKRKLDADTQEEIREAVELINQKKPIVRKAFSLKNLDPKLRYRNRKQEEFAESIEKNEITICTGAAGTGKTYVACGTGINMLKTGAIEKIYIVKSVTTLKDEEIGYLKGTMEEKMEPYIASFIHNFQKMIGYQWTETLRNEHLIEVMPVAFMRGITLEGTESNTGERKGVFVIIDEAQNLTRDHLKTILTRIGIGTKMLIMGDPSQIDRRNPGDSGLSWLIEKLSGTPGIGTVHFNESDIVRNPIIPKILEKLK